MEMDSLSSFLRFLFFCSLFTFIFGVEQCAREPDSLCIDSTCGFPLFDAHVNKACECVPEDIGGQFSECDSNTNTRQLVYFWRPPATCLGGALPEPVDGIPCNLVCGSGTFLNATTKQCGNCPTGSYGSGGGHKWNEWFEWPAQFRTYCALQGNPNGQCSSWRLFGETIDSGDNYNLHYLQSVLELRVKLVRPGKVSFHYRVSAERGFDGLWFYVNNLGVIFRSVDDWTYYTYNLSPGSYTLQWVYYKDRTVTSGEDRAQLSSIEVVGTSFAEIACDLCPLGHFQERETSSECKPCEPGTYSDIIGASVCKPCGVGQTSYYGSSSCFFQRSCNTSVDYSFRYSNCVNGERTKEYFWIEPASCDKTDSTLPSSVVEPCEIEPCPTGKYFNQSRQTCEYCPAGTARTEGNFCVTCAAGTSASHRHFYLDDWGSWATYNNSASPVSVTTGCKGDCFLGKGGWRLGQWFTDSGTSNGPDSRSWLTVATHVQSGSHVQFDYSLACSIGDYLTLSVNNQIVTQYNCQQNESECAIVDFETAVVEITPASTSNAIENIPVSLEWTFWKTTPTTPSSCDRALISKIVIKGISDSVGGSDICASCPAGTYSHESADNCLQCDVGRYSSGPTNSCDLCPRDTFADQKGYTECLPCDLGTVTEDRSGCNLNCSSYTLFDTTTNTTFHYNLAAFESFTVSYIQSENGTAFSFNIHGSMCEWSEHCVDSFGQPTNSFVCLSSDSQETINLGKTLKSQSYRGSFFSLSPNSPNQGITLTTSNGDGPCQFSLNIKCEPNAGVGSPSIISEADWNTFTNSCNYQVNWSSSYGCPLCSEGDFTFYDTECIDNSQERVYIWKNANCFGGVTLPDSVKSSCQPIVKVQVTVIVVIIITTVITLAIALAFIGYLYKKNRQLYSDYQQLKNTNIPMDNNVGLEE